MRSELIDKIARAILYEGYLLYPYRPSALKNQQRWNFGVLYPAAWAANQTGSDRSYFQMDCLAVGGAEARVETSVRFLQLVLRNSGERVWQKGIEREVTDEPLSLTELAASARLQHFSFGKAYGQIEITATSIRGHLFRITVRVRNTSDCLTQSRDHALLHSLASAHTVLQIRGGEFISQTDPPEDYRADAAACQNTGVWPVLVGENSSRDTMLGSPIILYDYPQVAPESPGDLFDSTEIDEILILRILTLSDQEKEELRRSDERARRILERLETSPPEHLLNLHGTMRGITPLRDDAWSAWDTSQHARVCNAVPHSSLNKGDRVRLRPRKRADIFDTLLAGKIAFIEAVEVDFEGIIHFAVVLEDDPGRDLGEARQAGHRFFFSAEELEPAGTAEIDA